MNPPKSISALPAAPGLRLIAAVYDLLPLLALWFLATVLALAVTGGALDVQRLADRLIVQFLVLAFSAAYFVFSWSRGGQTVGMKPWRLRVVRADGTSPDLPHALLRFAMALVSLVPAGLGFWWTLFDPHKRAWHDIAAGTMMVRMDKED